MDGSGPPTHVAIDLGSRAADSNKAHCVTDQLRAWLHVTESSIEVLEVAIENTRSPDNTLRDHLAELYSTRDRTRLAIEHAETELTRPNTLTEQLPGLQNDEATIGMAITQVEAMIPAVSAPHRTALQDEMHRLVGARSRTRMAIRQATSAIEKERARRCRAASLHARARLCHARSVRHSRSSRRTARVARGAAKKGVADPDGEGSSPRRLAPRAHAEVSS